MNPQDEINMQFAKILDQMSVNIENLGKLVFLLRDQVNALKEEVETLKVKINQ